MRLHKFNFPAQTSEDDTNKKAQKDIVREEVPWAANVSGCLKGT